MKIDFAIIRNGISRGILEGTKVPEKPTLRGLACLEDCGGECGDICPVIAAAKQHNEIENGKYQDAVQALWDSSVEWEDQRRIYDFIPASAWWRSGITPIDGIYPLEGVEADKVWQWKAINGEWEACEIDHGKDPSRVLHRNPKQGDVYREVLRLIPQPNSDRFDKVLAGVSDEAKAKVDAQFNAIDLAVEGTEVSEPLDTGPMEVAYAQAMAKPGCDVGVDEKKELAGKVMLHDDQGRPLREVPINRIISEKKESETVKQKAEKKYPSQKGKHWVRVLREAQVKAYIDGATENRGVSEGEPNQEDLFKEIIQVYEDYRMPSGFYNSKEAREKVLKLFHIQKLKL